MEIVYGISEKLVTDLGSHVLHEIGSAKGVKKDLEKLKETVSTINAVLMDAEEQQQANYQVKSWLRRIKDAAYEAEDILDDYETEALRRKLMTQGNNTIKKVCSFAYSIKSVAFRFKMSSRIKEVGQKFDVIAKDKNMFNFTERVVDVRVHNAERQTYSEVAEPEIFGRDGDKDEIIKLLLDEQENVSVIPIRGMGGLGKTTLAQLVYNDERVNTKFESKMWVCVSEEFVVEVITKKIIKSATNNECPDLDIDQLRFRLQELLRGNRFLLVLDDVWNEDGEKWDKLKFLLTGGAKGSKVLVTTRSEKVASIMGTIPTYPLKVLSNDYCWKLFKQKAFARRQEEAHPQLVVIGKEIAKKCGGLPLAAKTLGSIMLFKTEVHQWELVRDNDIWRLPQKENDILPALRLSYNHLPFYLKQCFAYCSLYPKDHKFEKDNLIQNWIAQGLIHSLEDGQCIEDIGNEYVNELLWRSFFQEPEEDEYGNLIHFKVHDLVCDLARDVGRLDYYIQEEGTKVEIPKEVRHLNLEDIVPSETIEALRKISNLRSLNFGAECLDDNDMFSNFKCLRDLGLYFNSSRCPSSIGKLKHLRNLCLGSLVIQTLPKSVTKLQNLQTFDVQNCPMLRELPKDMGNMINLRHIYLAEEAPLSHMPFGLSNLTSLRTLSLFVVGKDNGSKLNELHGLIHLGGRLTVKNLENVSSARDSAETDYKGKKKLEWLKLVWNEQDGHGGIINVEENNVVVLETLEPHPNLKCLIIQGYGGAKFPPWMMWQTLVEVCLSGCRNCQHLPPFGEIPSLKKFKLSGFPNLENWEEKPILGLSTFPCLVELSVANCPKLRNMPILPSLKILCLEECSELVQSLAENNSTSSLPPNSSSFAALENLTIVKCNDLVSLPEDWLQGLQVLTDLKIEDCGELTSLSNGMGYLTSLQTLEISKLPKLVSLPQGVGNATQLQALKIKDCDDLIALPDSLGELTSLRTLTILYCTKLQFLPDGIENLTALEILDIVGCMGLMSWPNWLGNLTWLMGLGISCTDNLPFLPEQIQHLTALQKLVILNCEILPEWMVNLPWLRDLAVHTCPNLQYLPEWMKRLTVLEQLYIYGCYQLTPRCKKETGEDWHKIAHIPTIMLDNIIIQGN